MNSIVITGIAIFFAILLIHIVVWNILRPKSEITALFALFIIFPAMMFIPMAIFASTAGVVEITLLYYALAAAYIQSYPGFKITIPSFKILQIIYEQRRSGAKKEEIAEKFDRHELIDDRLNLLVVDRLAIREGPIWVLTWRGKVLVYFFIFFRKKIYGMELGEG
ncbi:MAG: hypothetical protein HQK52_16630 [Oligoflexia bacterium]|nr:hypothetical protein [Oligoflexia bacterium]